MNLGTLTSPRRWLIVPTLLIGLLPTGYHLSQNVPTQTVAILVRDLAGSPMGEVWIGIYRPGPGGVRVGLDSTGMDGIVRFLLPTGSYLVTFEGNWGAYTFIPRAEQNAGAMTTQEAGGYGIQVEPQPEGGEALLLFTIALDNTGRLVPLFDLSAGPADRPIPYLYEGAISDEVSIDRSQVSSLTNATLAAPVPENTSLPTPAPRHVGVAGDIIGLLVMLVVVVLILLVLGTALIRQLKGTGEEI